MHPSRLKSGFPLKKGFINLLSGRVQRRVARNFGLSKIKPGVSYKFRWLAITSAILIFLSGYYPTFTIPPVKSSVVFAQTDTQEGQITASSFPKPLILPHPGYLSTRFSKFHPGIDIAIGFGIQIHPIIDGVVEQVHHGFFGLGHFVVLTHVNDFKSIYGHMGKIYVKVGQMVSSDSTLGEVGMSGATSGPHTHLEVTHEGKYIDPLTILPPIPTMPEIAQVRK